MKSICGRAGIPYGWKTDDGINFHDIRRTLKTNMLYAGVDKVYSDNSRPQMKGMDIHYLEPSEDVLFVTMEKFTR